MTTPLIPDSTAPSPGRRSLRVLVGLAVGAVCLALAFWGAPLDDVANALSGARWGPLFAVAALFLWQQGMRAWRQMVIIRAVAPESTYRTNLSVLCVSFLAINTLPGRIGELVRPLLMLERDRVPLGVGLALIFVERVADLCAAFTMLALAMIFAPPLSATFELGGVTVDWLVLARGAALTLLPTVLVAVVALAVAGRRLIALVTPLFARGPRLWRRLGSIGLTLASTFVTGFDALKSPRRLLAVVGITFVTWAVSIWIHPLLAVAFGFGSLIGYGEGMGVLAVLMLGNIVPAPPGQAGTYEAIVRGGLALYGVVGDGPTPAGTGSSLDAAALAYALAAHWWIMLIQALTALYFLAADRIDLRRVVAMARSDLIGTASPPEA